METTSRFFDALRRVQIILMAALIILVNLISAPYQITAKAAGNNCIPSGPLGGTYTVTPCLTNPADGATVSGNQTVTVTATLAGSNTGISKLIFYLNGQYLITAFQSPYTFVLPTIKFVDGSQVLAVAVTMKDGFISQQSSITLTFNNGVTTPPVNNNPFTPTSGTTPPSGQPYILAAAGDGADGAADAGNVTNLIASWNPNLFLYLGDVYEDGSPTEFYNWYGSSSTFFGRFRSITDPIIGNHEYTSGASSGYFDYWGTFPNATTTDYSYYSYDAAGWHFIALNSNCTILLICGVGQQEYQWLQNDLSTHSNACTLAFYHHPVYNIGQEGNTTTMNPIWSLLAQNGVDIVLNGHEHDYQRWVPLDGNGIPSSTGTTEFIAGGGGHGTTPFITTDSRLAVGLTSSPTVFGALRLQLNQYGANYQYINYQGSVLDSGVVPCSGAPADTTAPTPPTNLTATPTSTKVNLNWNASTDAVGVANYDIYRNGSLLTSIGPVTSYSDTNVTLGAIYNYQIKARDSAGNVSGFSNTAQATISSLLFYDGFESGNLNAWTFTTNTAVQQLNAHTGTYAALATGSGSAAAYASETLSTSQSDLYYNLWFNEASQGGTSAFLQRFRTSANGGIAGVYISSTGKLAYQNDSALPATTTASGIIVTKNVWHQLQTHIHINGASGQIEVWYDGAPVAALSTTDNFGTNLIGQIHLGDNHSSDIFSTAFDDVGANNAFINTGGTTTTTTLSALSPVIYGAPVTFTATVSPAPTDGITVNFFDGSTLIGSGTTSAGVASYTTTPANQLNGMASPHSITAAFSGDISFAPSTSAASSQVVNKKALTMNGLSVPTSKVYNSNTAAVVSGIPTLQAAEAIGAGTTSDGKPYLGDAVSITGTTTGTYDSKDVATATTVTFGGLILSGAQSGNYSLTIQNPAPATISVLPIIGSITANNKVFDGNNSATLATRTLTGVISPDVVNYVGGTATFDTPAVGIGKTVTAIGLSLSGADSSNYSVNSTATTTADITSQGVPPAATLVTPTGNIGVNYNPTYTWNQVAGSTWYQLSVDGPSGNVILQWYTSAQVNCNGSTCSITPAATLAGGTAYNWKVMTYNSVGNGPWSSPMSFNTTGLGLPGAATLVTPTGNIGTNNNPAYTWNQVTGSTWYQLSVDGPSGNVILQWYTSAQTNCNGSTCSLTPSTGLAGGTAYTWKIQTYNAAGNGPWSTPMSFNTTGVGLPGAATLVTPTGNIGTNNNPTYTWNQVTTSTWYQLSVDGPSGNVILQWYTSAQANCNGTTCSVTPGSTLTGGAFTWKIMTYNAAGNGPWSTPMSFSTTVPSLPGTATLVTPNGSIGTNHNPIYTWNQVTGSTWYYLWVNGPSGTLIQQWYTSAQAACNGTTCSVTPATTLTGGAYTWWVETYNSVGNGLWSSAMNFNVSP